MRDAKRLDDFYTTVCKIHKEHFPDWRFGQLFCNLQIACGNDLFYVEEDEMIERLKKFVMMG